MYIFDLQALSDGKCIASAHWLNDVLTDQKLFPPSNPLHFPTAFKWLLPGADRYVSSKCLVLVQILEEGRGERVHMCREGGRERGGGGEWRYRQNCWVG